jgi:hypothetical protein
VRVSELNSEVGVSGVKGDQSISIGYRAMRSQAIGWRSLTIVLDSCRRKAGVSGLRSLDLICDTTKIDEKTLCLSAGYLAAQRADIAEKEANIAKVREVVESFGFESVRRREMR